MNLKFIKYSELDANRSKSLDLKEIKCFIKNDFELQEFLFKYTNLFTYENATRRFKENVMQYN